jgi:hypothetical protein
MKKYTLVAFLLLLSVFAQCKSEKKDDSSSTLALLALLSSSSSSGFSTTCTTTFGAGVPTWIQNSFTCVTVSVSGSNYVFKTTSVPTYKSIYWGTSSAGYESTMYVNSTKTNAANPNSIKSQNITITVPSDPTTSGAPATGFGAIGVAANGIVIYNDQAAPGDTLATEYYTFDTAQGHPTNTGAYHYHVDPPKITTGNSAAFVGIALDGYLIFGKTHDTTATANSTFSLGSTSSSTACTSFPTIIPSSWSQAANYTSARTTAGNARHYHVNSGTEVNGIILSGKYIGTAGTSI